jgi:uncharacterized protein YbbC (DUF1343 family)/CubicO group peptidase (beta-lactamase class C family)
VIRILIGLSLSLSLSLPVWAFDVEQLKPIEELVNAQIRAGNLPGAVVLVGHEGKVVYRRAFGQRTLNPPQPMTAETIFDLASLTKPIVTATAILQLAERGKLDLAAPAARYWPAFAAQGKEAISVRQLLTHTSGLAAGLPLKKPWRGREAALSLIVAQKPQAPPGSTLLYSDVNFIVLGELVRRISGMTLDVYAQRQIFQPLAMKDSRYFTHPPSPDSALYGRIAPTGFVQGHLRVGEVHDPLAWRMGGVAGHAGMFSTADDLAKFAQTLLDGGGALLQPESVALLETPQISPAQAGTGNALRSLGWRSDPPLVANRDQLPPVGAMGHNGYTGTSLWIDPLTRTYVIILSHRVHPAERGDAGPLRERIALRVAEAVGTLSFAQAVALSPVLARYAELPPRHRSGGGVMSGIDVLAARDYARLQGLRIGLITHQSGVDGAGRRTIDRLRQAPGVKLVALFSPEHGLQGRLDERVPSGVDAVSGLVVHSLYGQHRRPTPAMLEGLDALVFDLQDVGARFYTYISTMGYAMEAAAQKGIRFIVLDRPDPVGGVAVEGPMLDPQRRSFTAYYPLPVRHGMTVGELALLFAGEQQLKLHPEVIQMRGYRRAQWFDQTGLLWIPPSPNLRNMTAVALYPGLGMIEGARVSVGRGTASPFELVGAPWMDGDALAQTLNARHIPGVRFESIRFTPVANVYARQPCQGVRVILVDRESLETSRLGIELAAALQRMSPQDFGLEQTLGSIGSQAVIDALRAGRPPEEIVADWQTSPTSSASFTAFRAVRQKYLLY